MKTPRDLMMPLHLLPAEQQSAVQSPIDRNFLDL